METKRAACTLTSARLDELECAYEAEHPCGEESEAACRLYFRILGLMGRQHAAFLRAYTDHLIALFNKDTEWFYRKGWEDGAAAESRKPRP